jgi:hypothetical protein
MQINITITERGNDKNVQRASYTIKVSDLKTALKESYLGLGTPYSPIPIDNFVELGNNEFPTIYSNSKIHIWLDPNEPKPLTKDLELTLVCCKVINVGKHHIDGLDGTPDSKWNEMFVCKGKRIVNTPDGTLYVASNPKGICKIKTRKKAVDATIAYSIIFSTKTKNKSDRSYYFTLDPVVRVSSGEGSNGLV